MILAIETATPVCSVALLLNSECIFEKRVTGKGIHSEMLFLFIKELFEDHQITIEQIKEVLFSIGPGQYTGLRIGAAGVKGVLFGRKIPLFAIGTLEGFAAGLICRKETRGYVHAVIDARRNHIYHQKFHVSDKEIIKVTQPAIRAIAELDQEVRKGDSVTGTGFERLHAFSVSGINFYNMDHISAENLIMAKQDDRFSGWFEEKKTATFEPMYLASGQVNNTNVHQ